MGNPCLKFCRSTEGIENPLRQGEILSGIIQLHIDLNALAGLGASDIVSDESDVSLLASPVQHPYAIVVSHECDLEQDFNNSFGTEENHKLSQELPNILFCEVEDAYVFEHDPDYENILPRKSDSTAKKNFRSNNDSRFHFIEAVPPRFDSIGQGLPALAVIFKRHFTMPSRAVYRQIELNLARRRTLLNSPYAEDLCYRFHHFSGRIALPEQFDTRRPTLFEPLKPVDSNGT